GKVIASYSAHVGSIVSHDLLRVELTDQGDFGFLYAYLRSRFGRAMLSSSQYGGVIKHLEPEHVLQLPVPTVGRSLVISLNSRMRQVFALRDAALRLTLRAENLYASVLGQVPDVDIDLPYAVPASNIFSRRRRLD